MNKPADLLASESFEVRFTADEFMRLLSSDVFEDARLELIGGELVHMAPPLGGHASKQANVLGALWPIARSAGLHLMGEIAIRIDGESVLVCDAALLRLRPEDRSAVDPSDALLVVEIAETTTQRDLVYKPVAYAGAGIATYWAVEGQKRIVHVFTSPRADGYAEHLTIAFGAAIPVPGTSATIVID